MDITVGVSLIGAAIAAVGAPGVTFWVMRKMTANFMKQNQEQCVQYRSALDGQIKEMKSQDKMIMDRQARLRENEIPALKDLFAMKVDVQNSTSEIKAGIAQLGKEMKADMKDLSDKVSNDIRRVHERVDHFHDGRKPHV